MKVRLIRLAVMGKDKKEKHKKDTDKKRKRDKDDDHKNAEKARKLVAFLMWKWLSTFVPSDCALVGFENCSFRLFLLVKDSHHASAG